MKTEFLTTQDQIQSRIFTIRGVQVMLDRDLAQLYEVETRVLKQAVRRNIESFPEDFMLVLTNKEVNELISKGVSQFVIPPRYNTGGANMFAFTEQGVAMLASVLKSDKAFITELIGRATKRVVLIDGYVNATTINLLDARAEEVTATIYTHSMGESLKELRKQYNEQYPGKPLTIDKWRTEQHDRWLIIDDALWHCGASLKDAGVKTFGIDPIGLDVEMILGQV